MEYVHGIWHARICVQVGSGLYLVSSVLFSPEGDIGRMDMAIRAREVARNSIFLTHWGLYKDYPFSGWDKSHR